MVLCEWGGIPAESWTSKEVLSVFPEFNEQIVNLSNAEAIVQHTPEFKSIFQVFNESLKANDLGTIGEWGKEI